MKKLVQAFLAFLSPLAFLPDQAAAAPLCSRDVMCVETVENGDTVEVYVENRQTAEVTVTLSMTLKNMESDAPLPHTETYPGLSRVKALTLKAAEKDRDWGYHFGYKWTWGSIRAAHDDAYVYQLPYAPGQGFRVDQAFNGRFSHYGDFQYSIDFAMPRGTPIHAARDGVVVAVVDRFGEGGPHRQHENEANYVMIKHVDGTIAEYDHLQAEGAQVQVGDVVRAGQVIALSGNSGFSTGPHLHFFVYKAVDGGRRESIPVRFRLEGEPTGGIIAAGNTYLAPALEAFAEARPALADPGFVDLHQGIRPH